jgi:hypothetical protein
MISVCPPVSLERKESLLFDDLPRSLSLVIPQRFCPGDNTVYIYIYIYALLVAARGLCNERRLSEC